MLKENKNEDEIVQELKKELRKIMPKKEQSYNLLTTYRLLNAELNSHIKKSGY